MAVITLMGCLLLAACSVPATTKDIVGKWYNQSGAILIFKSDGSFVAEHLPGGSVFWPSENFAGFNGYGHWRLGTGEKKGEVILNFDNNLPGIETLPGMKSGFDTQLLLGKNDTGWYLFGWIEEEGGERFAFTKHKQDEPY